MKITASVDSQLGDRLLERGKTYDIAAQEAKFLLRAGLGRESAKNAQVEKTVEAAKVKTPEDFQPGEDSAPSGTASGNTTVSETSDSAGSSASTRSTRKAGK